MLNYIIAACLYLYEVWVDIIGVIVASSACVGLYVWKQQVASPLTTVYPKKYAHGFVVLCFVVVMQSFIMNSHEAFIHIHQGCFAGTGAIVRLPQCQWSKPDGYGTISQCITTTKHSKAVTVCIFLGIYCNVTNTITISLWCIFTWLVNKVNGSTVPYMAQIMLEKQTSLCAGGINL